MDILGQGIFLFRGVCVVGGEGLPVVGCNLALSLESTHQMAAAHLPPLQAVKAKMFPHIARCPLMGRVTPVENHWCIGHTMDFTKV